MTTPIPSDVVTAVAALPTAIVPNVTTGEVADTLAAYAALKAAVPTINALVAAASATIPASRIADASLPITKLAVDVTTQAEHDAFVATNATALNTITTALALLNAAGNVTTADVGDGQITLAKLAAEVVAQLGVGGGTARSAALVKLDGALATRATTPCRVVFTGSSTTAGSNASAPAKRWTNVFTTFLQVAYPSGLSSETQVVADTSASFGTISTAAGVHGYNAGEGSTTAATYLTATERTAIAALAPSAIFHMVGSNDFAGNVVPATFKANLLASVNDLKTKATTRPLVQILVNAYERWDTTTHTYAWALYGAAMKEIADADPTNVVYVDLNPLYIAYSIPGAKGTPGGTDPATDPYGLISSDKIHQDDDGHAQMAKWVWQAVMGTTPPTGTVVVTPPSAAKVTDTFTRTNTTSLGAADTGQTWSAATGVWATDGTVAYMVSGSLGIATIACGYSDVTYSAAIKRPTSGSHGIRVRAGSNAGIALYFDATTALLNISTIVAGTNAVRTTYAIPAGITVGTMAKLTLVASGTAVTAYLNDVLVPELNYTLTTAENTAIIGTDIAIRQTVAGIANGGVDNLSADSVDATAPIVAATITDTFNRTSTTTLATADTGQVWVATAGVGGTNAATKVAYPVSGASFIASLPTTYTDVSLTVPVKRPTAGVAGIFVRGATASSRVALYFDFASATIKVSTVIGAVNTERRSTAMPTGIAIGTVATLRLDVVGATVTAYVNGTQLTDLNYTLTTGELTGITGTNVGLRATVVGEAATSFGTLGVTNLGVGSGVADPAAFPTGNLQNFRLVLGNNFTTDVALGSARSTAAYSGYFGYDFSEDTSKNLGRPVGKRGNYSADKTVTVSGGTMKQRHYYDTTDQKFYVCAVTPPGISGAWGQLYGKWSVRLRITGVTTGSYTKADGTTGTANGYKIAYLLWPAISAGNVDPNGVTVIDPWDYGEVDWPETSFGATPKGYSHVATGSAGSRNHGNAFTYETGTANSGDWHTFSVEWTPGNIKFLLDEVVVKTGTGSAVPFIKMYWAMQGETWLDSIVPPTTSEGTVEIDWIAQWAYDTAAVAP